MHDWSFRPLVFRTQQHVSVSKYSQFSFPSFVSASIVHGPSPLFITHFIPSRGLDVCHDSLFTPFGE